MPVGRCSSKLSGHELQAKSKKSQAPTEAKRSGGICCCPSSNKSTPKRHQTSVMSSNAGRADSRTIRRPCLVERKIILKLVLELKSRGHHSQAGIAMNGIMPRSAMKRLMVAFLRVPGGSSPNRTERIFGGLLPDRR